MADTKAPIGSASDNGRGERGERGRRGPAGPAGPTGAAGADGATGPSAFASFFGMTVGPGNADVDDYPATILASSPGPSVAAGSAINFPRAAVTATGGIVINDPGGTQADNTEFLLPVQGVYRVTWHISVDEPAQWSLWLSANASPAPGGEFNPLAVALGDPSTVGQAMGTAQLVGDVVFETPFANVAIQIRNFSASGGTLTVTPTPGGTQAQAVVLTIERLA